MITTLVSGWEDYELLATGAGQRLERFGTHVLSRPDPNILWPQADSSTWKKSEAVFVQNDSNKGWKYTDDSLEAGWQIAWKSSTFLVRPTPFRHMGLFPEQSANWEWLEAVIKKAEGTPKVLNLFAYTGAASVIAAKAGASVCHVDASKGSIRWAQENAQLSGLPGDAIRWIEDDVLKFLRREVRRGSKYDIVILDPPVFGRGPKGEIFRLEERIQEMLELVRDLLSEKPLGFLLNFYATAIYPESIARLAETILHKKISSLELHSLCLAEKKENNLLPTGFFLRS